LPSNDIIDIHKQPLWNNKYITYRHNPLFIDRWVKANINTVGDVLLNDNFALITHIANKTGYYPTHQFDYNAVYTAVMAFKQKNPDHTNPNRRTKCHTY